MAGNGSQTTSGASYISAKGVVIQGGTFNQHNISEPRNVLKDLYPKIDHKLFHDSQIYEHFSLPDNVCPDMEAEFQEIMTWSTNTMRGRATPIFRQDLSNKTGVQSMSLVLKVAQKLSRNKLLLAGLILPSNPRYDQHKIIYTFVHRMATSIPSTQQHIIHAIQDQSIFDLNTETQIEKLIKEPLIKAASAASPDEKNLWPYILFIDGPHDQIVSSSTAGRIAHTLYYLSKREDLGITFGILLVTSNGIRDPWPILIFLNPILQKYRMHPLRCTLIIFGVVFD